MYIYNTLIDTEQSADLQNACKLISKQMVSSPNLNRIMPIGSSSQPIASLLNEETSTVNTESFVSEVDTALSKCSIAISTDVRNILYVLNSCVWLIEEKPSSLSIMTTDVTLNNLYIEVFDNFELEDGKSILMSSTINTYL